MLGEVIIVAHAYYSREKRFFGLSTAIPLPFDDFLNEETPVCMVWLPGGD